MACCDPLELFSGPLDEAGLDTLALIMEGLEYAMEYPPVKGVRDGMRLWDTVVCGGGDVMLPRLIRVEAERSARLRAYIVDRKTPPGLYSGRVSVDLSNRSWKLINARAMVAEGRGACNVVVRLYGLVFVRALPASSAPPVSAVLFPELRLCVAHAAAGSRRVWSVIVEWVRDAAKDNSIPGDSGFMRA